MSETKRLISGTTMTAVELAGQPFLVEEIVDRHGPRYVISNPHGTEVRDQAIAASVLTAYALNQADPETTVEEWELASADTTYRLTVNINLGQGTIEVTAAEVDGRPLHLDALAAADLTDRLFAAEEV
jgi:hypothetical protein